MNFYIGNPLQTRGAEQYVLQNGKGDGMHFLYVRNGLGLEAWISLDRCADLSRVSFKGDNMNFFSPCGYVAPQYYDDVGEGFLKSFTAGFMTTCGLAALGAPSVDNGEELPLHGTIANTPSVLNGIEEDDEGLTIKATVTDARIFTRKLTLQRTYYFSYKENTIAFSDKVTNIGDTESPYMVLYHCNMGYPLLDETSTVVIPNNGITARTQNAADTINTALVMEKPQTAFVERCYFYDVKESGGLAHVGIFNDKINKGVMFEYDKKQLPYFTEWKMMGKTDYVLGLEPSNSPLESRSALRERGELKQLKPLESGITSLKFIFTENKKVLTDL